MQNAKVKLLKKIIEIPSPSGYEEQFAKYVKKELSNYISKNNIDIDFHHNVTIKIKGLTDKKVMIDAHSDVLGFLVYNIDKEGYISLTSIGGYDVSILRGRKVLIMSEKHKAFEGVIGTKHAHLVNDDKEDVPTKISDITLDIGVRKRKQVLRYIAIGDPVILKPGFNNLLEEYFVGTGFDDKAGCYILLQTIKELSRQRKKPIPTLLFTFSSQEEVDWRGAKELARRYRPDLFIGFDVTCATDYYDIDEREAGRCELGKGLTLYKGINIHRPSLKLMQNIARLNKVKVQYQATNAEEGYNAEEVAGINDGIRVLCIGIPCRNLHSPVEIINFKDLDGGVKLLKRFLLSKKLGKVVEK